MKNTRICDLLRIRYPIIQGGMNWITNAELAAAVSNAGGLGIISPTAGMNMDGDIVENLREQIRKTRGLTRMPFGVNLPLVNPWTRALVDLVVDERVPVVTTSAGSPASYTLELKEAEVIVLHVVASVRHATSAEKRGVDAVIAEGYEAGGHNGFDELPTFVLVPQVVDAVRIPVIAAGGIMDARGVVAALALGAEGVQVGTRFIVTHECIAHPAFKQAIIDANDAATHITGRGIGPTRGLKTEATLRLAELESQGVTPDEMRGFLGVGRARKGQVDGDLVEGEAYCGAGAGMIKEIIGAREVVESLVNGVAEILTGHSRLQ